jgi:mycothiol maleylpyruvate isomerase-like protein
VTAVPDDTWNVITESLGLLKNASAPISEANGDTPTPCTQWTVTQVLQHVEPLRQFGAYAPALPPQAGDGHATELLRYLGRNPRWTANSPGQGAPR